MNEDNRTLADIVGAQITVDAPAKLGVAVSGGSDSMALLYILADWAKRHDITLCAVTVDHGLRSEAAREAAFVASTCEKIGVSHKTLKWTDWDKSGNLQDQARRARYRLMADWGVAEGVEQIALGHTVDDQAETFLMRLARQAGVDGLSGMAPAFIRGTMTFVRPVLAQSRAELRAYLIEQGGTWVEDPSNEDQKFERVKARQVLKALGPLGISTQVLAAVTDNLAQARAALAAMTHAAAQDVAKVEGGDVVFDRRKWKRLQPEIARRLLLHAINWVASAEYGPRWAALAEIQSAIHSGGKTTLHGCLITTGATTVRIAREYNAVKDISCPIDAVWDGRWRMKGPEINGLEVRPLGLSGLGLCPDWRATGAKRTSLLACPAIWNGPELVAAPLAGMSNGWTADLVQGADHFYSSLLTH